MRTIKIGNDERSLGQADAQWITQEINGRRQSGAAVCVIVAIKTDDLDLRLSTPACGGAGGGGRQPTNREQAVLDLWRKHKLNDSDFSPGGVVAFVKQVSQFL